MCLTPTLANITNNMKAVLLILNILIVHSLFSQNTNYMRDYYKDNFIFNSGFWVYEDTLSNSIDSISIVNFSTGLTFPHPNDPDYYEFFLIDYHSYSYNYSYNDYFVLQNHMKRNGGGQYGQLGQPIMFGGGNTYPPTVGTSFNGCEIIAFIDSIEIKDIKYYDVIHTKIYKTQQYQQEFSYDTELFFAPGVGLVRKQYTDSFSVNYVWDLINWQADNSAFGVPSVIEEKKIKIYPNPTAGNISIDLGEMKAYLTTTLTNSLGQVISKEQFESTAIISIDIDAPAGIYFLQLDFFLGETKVIKVLKE